MKLPVALRECPFCEVEIEVVPLPMIQHKPVWDEVRESFCIRVVFEVNDVEYGLHVETCQERNR